MELLPLVCLCLLSCSGETSAAGDGVKVVVKEDSDAVLPCSLSNKEDIRGKTFDWRKDERRQEVYFYDSGIFRSEDQQFIDRVSHFQNQLKNGNASIKITKTKMADSGNYSCIFPHLQPRQTFYIELVVGAASEPSVTSIKTDDGTVLQCVVRGASPKPKVEWRDSSGNILPVKDVKVTERGDSYDIVLQAALTKTDNFRCVVTQEEISHKIYAEIDATNNGSNGTVIALVVFIALFVVAVVVAVVAVVLYHKIRNKLIRAKDEEKREPQSEPNSSTSLKNPPDPEM